MKRSNRIALAIWLLVLVPVAAAIAVGYAGQVGQSWPLSVWGERHMGNDLPTFALGLTDTGILGWLLIKWANVKAEDDRARREAVKSGRPAGP